MAHHDPRDPSVPDEHHVNRTGHWLSQDRRHQHAFLKDTIDTVDKSPKELHPILRDFKADVARDSRLGMLLNAMFQEIPQNKPHLTDPSGESSQVRDFDHLLAVLNHILTTAPHWTKAEHQAKLVGVPMLATMDWCMGTRSGFAALQDPKVNTWLKKVLDVWGKYLISPDSASVLNDGEEGWFGPDGKPSLEEVANLGKKEGALPFEKLFECDPSAKYHGYKSWDDFFTRRFRFDEGTRPVASPDDDDVVANACESKFYKLAHDVQARQPFWIKSQPYSVLDMLDFDPHADSFVGGTVYQAFLSALSYHRWASPVSGTVVTTRVIPGTYFSEPQYTGFTRQGEADSEGQSSGQEYLSALATRGLILIKADNPKLGIVAFIGIGMIEVSTCDITVKEGQHVRKGDQLGMFHFGGSTHAVLFQKGVKLVDFPQKSDYNVPVRSQLCRVV